MFCECFDFSKEYASQIAELINRNGTLAATDYLLHPLQTVLSPSDAVKQTGSSHVSVIGPDDEFVAATVLVVALVIFTLSLQSGPEKNAQSLMHHHFSIVCSRITVESPKCSEILR